jgi:hypothetical protein
MISHRPLIFLVLMALVMAACVVPDNPGVRGPEATITPPGDTLSYFIPAYSLRLAPGETVPGTRLTYVGRQGDGYEVRINDLTAVKRAGDSFFWSGILAPGVFATYNLRLNTSIFGGLGVSGPVEFIVFYPDPVEVAPEPDRQARLHFVNTVLDYRVPVGHTVPGTTLIYQGVEQQGSGSQIISLARFGGLSSYPYLATGDSMVWNGRLRDGVFVRYNLHAISITDEEVRLAGLGELWVED